MRNQRFFANVKGIACSAIILMVPIVTSYGSEEAASNRIEASTQRKVVMKKQDTSEENPELLKELLIQAARAGDKMARQKIRMQLKDKDPVRQFEAIEMAKSVGGPDMIRALADLLNDTNGYRSVNLLEPAEESSAQDDVVFEPPRILAAKALAEIVENPPVPPVGRKKKFYTEEDILTWLRWWEVNKNKYGAAR